MKEQPRISPFLLHWFTWYSRRLVKRSFHSLRVSRSQGFVVPAELPIVLYTNHASWWDPLVGLIVISAELRGRSLYAPMDATMLAKYRMFGKMGFFGVEKDTRRGAIEFLARSEDVLSKRNALLAVTAQGRFADVRERPAGIKRGIAHLAVKVPNAIFIPACIEYVFWEEKLPEILVRLGSPVNLGKREADLDENAAILEQALELTQDELATLSINRAVESFKTLIAGKTGIGGVYDRWRSLRAKLSGKEFRKEVGRV